jgi:ABC-2 type transport system ATP-binding protein
MVIEVLQLNKRYGARVAVDDLSFGVAGGDILGLVGPNGAGKTTTLRALAGILPPSSGWIRIAGHDMREDPVGAKRRLALVPDEPSLFDALTVWEHLEFTARIYGVAAWQPAAAQLLAELELTDRSHSLAGELSRGMRQKVAVACALLHEPAALLLDEPLTGLDPRGIRTLYATLRERASRGAAVMVSSHLLGQIEPLCTRFLIVHRGRLLHHGSKTEIVAQLGVSADSASLEEIFFEATEGQRPADPAHWGESALTARSRTCSGWAPKAVCGCWSDAPAAAGVARFPPLLSPLFSGSCCSTW